MDFGSFLSSYSEDKNTDDIFVRNVQKEILTMNLFVKLELGLNDCVATLSENHH